MVVCKHTPVETKPPWPTDPVGHTSSRKHNMCGEPRRHWFIKCSYNLHLCIDMYECTTKTKSIFSEK